MADSLALAAALIFLRDFRAESFAPSFPLNFAHLARAAAAMLARPAALIIRFPRAGPAEAEVEPFRSLSSCL